MHGDSAATDPLRVPLDDETQALANRLLQRVGFGVDDGYDRGRLELVVEDGHTKEVFVVYRLPAKHLARFDAPGDGPG